MIVQGLPHACGGVSFTAGGEGPGLQSSPRMWGCFWAPDSKGPRYAVFPTHVGVFLLHHILGHN